MNNLNILQDQGFPVQAKTLRFLQEAYQGAIQHLASMYGANMILYGCELVSGNRTAGAVVINGELLTFEAGADAAKVSIVETIEQAVFQGGEALPAYYTRKARCASVGVVNFADLKRLPAFVKGIAQPKETDWANCTPTPDITVIDPIQCRINDRGRVEIRGRFRQVDHAYFHIFTIPAALRPKYNQLSFAQQTTDNMNVSASLFIRPSGTVSADPAFNGMEYALNCEYDL